MRKRRRSVPFLDRLSSAGYASADDFFLKNANKSFARMGRMLRLSIGGLQYHYRKWAAKAMGRAWCGRR